MFGYTEAEAIGHSITDLTILPAPAPGSDGSTILARGPVEAVGLRKDGSAFPVEVSVTTVTHEGETRRVAILRDITDRKAQQEALEHQATHDALTELPNRYLLQLRIREALAASWEDRSPVAFLLLDLDRFREINDALGHHTGDLLLQRVARRLRTPLRSSDTIARLGGDEFAVLLPSTDLETARQMAWKLIHVLNDRFRIDGISLQVDTSIGIAMFPEHGTDAESLIQRADVAMYVAKRERAGVAVYQTAQDYTSVRQLTLMSGLRSAIEDDQLRVLYQPKIAADTDRIVGVEALVRWTHERYGEIPPDEFVALAEHSGLIRTLTRRVLETSLRQCAEWRRNGIALDVSVNLSARNLLEEELPSVLAGILASHQLPPSCLTLEITESVIMEDPERALEIVTELDALGVQISIDDFGTGYSSLGYLKRLPAREIKIDRSFVMEMDQDVGDAMIVRSTIELAHNLGLEVVAEGVETSKVWDALKALGCDYGQGYLFSRPVPADRLPLDTAPAEPPGVTEPPAARI
jgi:diguanylate cyclase (GGDEF)-like protein